MNDASNADLRKEVTVGVFAFAVIIGLFVFSIFVTGGSFWRKGQTIEVIFTDVMGLRKGDNVVTRGMTVGEVKALSIDKTTGKVRVSCFLGTPVDLRADCSAAVVPTSILGGRQLDLLPGSMNAAAWAGGEPIPGKAPHDIMAEVGDVVREIRETIKKGALDDLGATIKSAKEIADKINKGEGTLGLLVNDKTMYKDITSVAADLKVITAQIREGKGSLAKLLNDDTVYNDLKVTMANAKDVSQRLADGKGTLGRLMSADDAVYNDLKVSMANMKEISQRLADGKGSLGKLLSADESIYNDAKGVLKDFRGAIDDYRESSPILTFTTIMFGAF